VFPLGGRGAVALVEQPTPDNLLDAIGRFRATALFTAPTAYRALVPLVGGRDISSLRRCISAGEALPKATSDAWYDATGMRIIDGIGATEMIHIFISAKGEDIRPGATGKPLPGYQACVLDDQGRPLSRPNAGRLAVKGPSGCRYLDDPRQLEYVQNGWNVTWRSLLHRRGWLLLVPGARRRHDHLGRYNIAGPEVEASLLQHPAVRECAVSARATSNAVRSSRLTSSTNAGHVAGDALARELQEHVKRTIAPYKYPRAVEFVPELPKTPTGKLQRYVYANVISEPDSLISSCVFSSYSTA
jgi:2-aminobenzoate-CoA ligase